MNATGMGSDNQLAQNDNRAPSLDWARVAELVNGCSGDSSNKDQKRDSSPCSSSSIDGLTNSQAKIREVSTEKALVLKRKELKWKLMRASQVQNRAKLNEIKTALLYHKRKLHKAQTLATKLRDKYVNVVKSANLSEAQLAAAEAQLASHEKHVADEKLQITKLAFECLNTGTSLYGKDYQLPGNYDTPKAQTARQSRLNLIPNKLTKQTCDIRPELMESSNAPATKEEILKSLSPFLRTARAVASVNKSDDDDESHNVIIDDVIPGLSRPKVIAKKRKRTFVGRVSSLYDLNDSILKNLASYRLTRKFTQVGTTQLTDLAYSHNIRPLEYVCLPDLLGECSDRSCLYQHKSNYFMTDLEKLTDLLSYRPAAAGWVRSDDDLDERENFKLCLVKLKQHAAKLISKNADKPVETIARAIVANDIRNNEPDVDLLLKRRQLPKAVHLDKRFPLECPCETISVDIKEDAPQMEYVLYPPLLK